VDQIIDPSITIYHAWMFPAPQRMLTETVRRSPPLLSLVELVLS